MKKASPKAVGGFVIGAVLIGMIAVIVFGSGRIFQSFERYVAFFSGSLQGLRLGAPVQFRGVQIGTVAEISVQFDSAKLDFVIPVILEINPDAVEEIGEDQRDADQSLEVLIEKGLRAQLAVQSFVTGQQSVQLLVRPDTEVHLAETDLPYEQIPTIPSTFAQMEQSVGEVLIDVSDILSDLKDFMGENRGTIEQTMADVRQAAANISAITEGVTKNRELIEGLLGNANETLLSYKSLAERAEGVVAENQDGLSQAISGLHQAEQKISEMAETANALLNENRAGMRDFTNEGLYEIKNLAVDAQAAVEQFRRVMEEMERDPARFLLGQPGQVEVE